MPRIAIALTVQINLNPRLRYHISEHPADNPGKRLPINTKSQGGNQQSQKQCLGAERDLDLDSFSWLVQKHGFDDPQIIVE